jgi:hypothetical protein
MYGYNKKRSTRNLKKLMKATLAQLKALPIMPLPLTESERLSVSWCAAGLPRGALVEISSREGGGKTELVMKLLIENPEIRAAWIESDFTIYPYAILESEISAERILYIEAKKKDPTWVAHQVLRSQLFALVVLSHLSLSENELRRLQIAAKKSSATVILLAPTTTQQGHWPISMQVEVSRNGDGFFIHSLRSP